MAFAINAKISRFRYLFLYKLTTLFTNKCITELVVLDIGCSWKPCQSDNTAQYGVQIYSRIADNKYWTCAKNVFKWQQNTHKIKYTRQIYASENNQNIH